MKAFYGGSSAVVVEPMAVPVTNEHSTYIDTHARVAVYDGPAAAPYVEDVGPAPVGQFVERLTVRVYELARERGGSIPYTVIREVAENLIHAGFAEPVVSILDSGDTIRFTDQGPGIPNKPRALMPGFTTARSYMKSVIRGVGSGLPIVSDFLSVSGGSLVIDDNLSGGTVVTVSLAAECAASTRAPEAALVSVQEETPSPEDVTASPPYTVASPEAQLTGPLFEETPSSTGSSRLTTRQKQVMALVLESGSAGPSVVSRELGVGLSTAYRDLASLEDLGLIVSDGGKRRLTEEGLSLLGGLSSTNDSSSL
ncbi:MAG TPA: ATP-binding protein [Coriobacteriia bacterium]|nr:ATP-binding protein [Coriobacteriia bacterium]